MRVTSGTDSEYSKLNRSERFQEQPQPSSTNLSTCARKNGGSAVLPTRKQSKLDCTVRPEVRPFALGDAMDEFAFDVYDDLDSCFTFDDLDSCFTFDDEAHQSPFE